MQNESSAFDILKSLPPARQESLIRQATKEILNLIQSAHNAVGFPKTDGRWTPALAKDLEAFRQAILNPKQRQVEP